MRLIWPAFFLSGVAGLSYELTWLRYLTHLLGATTPAVATVVGVFFLGLAGGAALGGRLVDRVRRPLRAYALLELSIGATAATVPLLFRWAEGLLSRRPEGDGPLLPLALAVLVLLPATTLLGATFPAMAAVLRAAGPPTRSTGYFYGINTLGAVCGCLLSAFALLPVLGQGGTTWVLALLNGAVAALVLAAGKIPAGDAGPARPPEGTAPAGDGAELTRRQVLLIAGVTGLLGIGIEVLWTRALILVFPATVHAFALILASYLVGIGLGALAVGAYHRRRAPRVKTLCLLLLLGTAGNLVTLFLLPRLLGWTALALSQGWLTSWTAFLLWQGGATVLILAPATLAMGATLPMLVGLATAGSRDAGRSAGRLYAVNTLCGVAGSFAATFVLMPALGVSRALFLLTVGYLGPAALLARRVALPRTVQGGLLALLLTGALTGALGLGPEVNGLREASAEDLVFYQDAPAGTVAVRQQGGVRSLLVNNYAALSHTEPATVAMQYALGHLPLLLHPRPERALLVGFATGTTLSAMAEHPLGALDCVELHEALPRLAPYFAPANQQVHKDPRVRVIHDDGRRFLARQGTRYDVIVGDLYFPRDAGVGALYSLEHFAGARARLADGGVLVTWLPLSHLGAADTAAIVQTFLQVFPHGEAWMGWWNAAYPALGLVGVRADRGTGADPVAVEARLRSLVVGALRRVYPELPEGGPPGLAQELGWPRRLLDAAELRRLAGAAPVNALERPVIEFSAPRAKFEERLRGASLALGNILQIAQVRPLEGTPWRGVAPPAPTAGAR